MDAFAHQDHAGLSGAPLGVFLNGVLIRHAPNEDTYGHATRAKVAAAFRQPESAFEILLTCPAHPATAAVDCLTCDPDD